MKKDLTYFVTEAKLGAKLESLLAECITLVRNVIKKGCFICKAYFFVLSQLEESEIDLQYQYSNDYLWRISTETNEFKFDLEKV